MVNVVHDLTIKPREAKYGTRKFIVRKNKRLEVTIPPGVKNGTLVKLSGALQITDGYYGDLFVQIHIKNTRRVVYVVSVIAILFIVISSIVIAQNLTTRSDDTNLTAFDDYITVFNNKQPESFSSYGKPIELVNNDSAVDPTWKELEAFLLSDKTEQQPYVDYSYECASYAEEVHNHAEARDIRAAFVAVFFSNEDVGHALNAFQTKDKGLIYIDCSGDLENGIGYDKVAYIEEGEELGVLTIESARSFDYNFYKDFKDIEFEPLGIVEEVYIYW